MDIKALKKEDLPIFIDNISREYELFGPVEKEFKFVFGKVNSLAGMRLDYPTTILPPKTFVIPQHETLFTFKLEGEPILEAVFETPKRVVFGMHSCDLHGIWLLDDIFAEGVHDEHYFARRRDTFFIGMDCTAPCGPQSFCKDMGTLKPGGGYEMFLTDLGDVYAVQVSTKGEALLKHGAFAQADYNVRDGFLETWRKKHDDFPNRIGYDIEKLPANMADSYEDIIWDALEERCLDCGACTVVCPTCYCFDVLDKQDLQVDHGSRIRRWDSCLLREFGSVAGGENFRGKRSDRLRHRLMRKGLYFKEKYNRFACVGCGRCVRACLAKIDIRQIFTQVGGSCS